MQVEPAAMPEITWKYRRYFAYGRTLLFSAMVIFLAKQIHDEGTKRTIVLCLLGLMLFDALLYMVGPTATDILRILKAVQDGRRSPRKLP